MIVVNEARCDKTIVLFPGVDRVGIENKFPDDIMITEGVKTQCYRDAYDNIGWGD
jgi:hypothetical protein